MRPALSDLADEAEAALAEVLGPLGFRLGATAAGSDLAIDLGGGRSVQLEVRSLAHASPSRVRAQIDAWARRRGEGTGPGEAPLVVLVADAIPDASRQLLDGVSWGWFDRRGHLRLRSAGLHVDTDVLDAPRQPAGKPRAPITGRAGLAVAFELLVAPKHPLEVRATARATGLNPSSVSRALARLREEALVETDGRPLVPELFWALAHAWPRSGRALKRAPSPDDDADGHLMMSIGSPAAPGWALAGTRGALAWGAPLLATGELAPELYVPSVAVERRSLQRYGAAEHVTVAGAVVQAAPLPTVVANRSPRDGEPWPLAHPVVVALDLAADRSRGAEVLEDWNPPAPFERVW